MMTDEQIAELARRLSCAYISVAAGVTFDTIYKKLKGRKPGQNWFELAQLLSVHAHPIRSLDRLADSEPDIKNLKFKGPIQ